MTNKETSRIYSTRKETENQPRQILAFEYRQLGESHLWEMLGKVFCLSRNWKNASFGLA